MDKKKLDINLLKIKHFLLPKSIAIETCSSTKADIAVKKNKY